MKINSINEFNKVAHLLPLAVFEDINKRISDWIKPGGRYEDPYIKQQFRYAEAFINAIGENK